MEKVINSYETLFIVKPELSEEETQAVVNKFSALVADNGTVEKVDVWGKRRLAYEINKHTEGCYVLINFKSVASFPAELRRLYGIDDKILRGLVFKLDEKKAAASAAEKVEETATEEAPVAEEAAE